MTAPLILASGSAARRAMLDRAGVTVETDPAAIDEAMVKQALQADGAGPGDVAETLAEMKAMRIARKHPGRYVLGADQMLVCGPEWFDKPADRAQAAAQLKALRGKTHRLISSAVMVRDGTRLWHHTETADLTMRPFSDAFLDGYLDRVGDAVLGSVGAYHIEGVGAQLFSRVHGDLFTILGLPLLPLLDYLRDVGVLPR